MKSILHTTFLLLLFVFFLLPNANSATKIITFETVPGGSPSDKLAISSQYEALYGVTFSTSTGGTPYLEKKGSADSGNGFYNDTRSNYDIAAVDYESILGDYYLRLGTQDFLSKPVPSLIISYSTPVSAASAQIWDIDASQSGFEQWIVKAYDSGNSLIETIISPVGLQPSDPNSLDGKPWKWSFDYGTNFDISSIEISVSNEIGSKTSGIGLAFDNFSPSSVPVPGGIWLLGSGLLGLVGIKRYRKKS